MSTINGFSGEYGWLSNFWPVRIEYEGVIYQSSEHLYQALKTVDPEERKWIAKAETPAEAKHRGGPRGSKGRKLTLRDGYQEDFKIRMENMRVALRLKFAAGSELAEMLLATGDAELIEGNHHHDNFWGDCHCERLPKCARKGSNMLGTMLMNRRMLLRLVSAK